MSDVLESLIWSLNLPSFKKSYWTTAFHQFPKPSVGSLSRWSKSTFTPVPSPKTSNHVKIAQQMAEAYRDLVLKIMAHDRLLDLFHKHAIDASLSSKKVFFETLLQKTIPYNTFDIANSHNRKYVSHFEIRQLVEDLVHTKPFQNVSLRQFMNRVQMNTHQATLLFSNMLHRTLRPFVRKWMTLHTQTNQSVGRRLNEKSSRSVSFRTNKTYTSPRSVSVKSPVVFRTHTKPTTPRLIWA